MGSVTGVPLLTGSQGQPVAVPTKAGLIDSGQGWAQRLNLTDLFIILFGAAGRRLT